LNLFGCVKKKLYFCTLNYIFCAIMVKLIRKYIIFLCLTGALVVSTKMQAADVRLEAYNFGYVSLGGGYTSLSQNVADVSTKGGLALLGGIGYEFRCKKFWLSVGAQYMMERSTTTVGTHHMYRPGKDNQDPPQDVTFHYLIDQVDKQDWRTVDIPVMLGYYNSGFYVGAGAKVGFSLGSTITSTGSYELRGQYAKYVGEWKNVNFYTTYQAKENKVKSALSPQVAIIGEAGYDVLATLRNKDRHCNILKVGFYFEYGLRSARPTDTVDPLSFNKENGLEIANEAVINPYYMTSDTKDNKIAPYMVGVKLTYMIGGNPYDSKTTHRGCHCYHE